MRKNPVTRRFFKRPESYWKIPAVLLALLLVSCRDNKSNRISIKDIIALNGKITHYKITYTAELFIKNGKLTEKGRAVKEYVEYPGLESSDMVYYEYYDN
jgi:hypothetical protein